jgi:magnesium-protoporphyrin IX monomethyl ester (oxidative) cyclase
VIYYGVESYKDEDLARIKKKITIDQVWDAVRKTHDRGIQAAGSFILGFPWQEIDDMVNTVKFAIKLNVDYAQFTVATPYPGTPLFGMAKKEDLIEVWDWSQYTTIQPIMRGFRFKKEDVGRILSWAYRKFYLRPRYVARNIFNGGFKTILEIIWRALRGYIHVKSNKVSGCEEEDELKEIDEKIKNINNFY